MEETNSGSEGGGGWVPIFSKISPPVALALRDLLHKTGNKQYLVVDDALRQYLNLPVR